MKHFRAHLERVVDMATSSDGLLMCTISNDKAIKVFDVVNFGEFKDACCVHVAPVNGYVNPRSTYIQTLDNMM